MHPIVCEPVSKPFTVRPGGSFAGMRVHLIGIGGCGMCGIATLLLDLGAKVTGSDRELFPGLGDLVQRGARVSVGHDESFLDCTLDLVAHSAAIPETNPELAAARRRGLAVMKYAELLGAIMADREGVAIAGTHGKSTTTAMCAHVFREAGLSPSFVVGAESRQLGGNGGGDKGRHFIVESCEFNRSFLHFKPRMAAVLNIEPDHVDCYSSLEETVEAFGRFCANVHPEGLLVCNAEERWAMEAARSGRARRRTFGFETEADWRAVNLRCDLGRFSFDVLRRGALYLSARLSIPGRHNVSNALAVIALAHQADAAPERVAEALASYSGISRRMSLRGTGRGVTILDDYAHHPTEVRVTIEAARDRYAPKRTWVIFQPHQYSRTRHFIEEFASSFGQADEVIVPDIYNAREARNDYGRTGSKDLVSRIHKKGGRARYLGSLDEVTTHLEANVTEGDLVLTMGAGDVWKVADTLVERICGAE
jgi:UDP-N-acetylmuramate--alanine ligase